MATAAIVRMSKIREKARRLWCIGFRHTRKNNKLLYYTKGFMRQIKPKKICRIQTPKKLSLFDKLSTAEQQRVLDHVNYYCRLSGQHPLPSDAPTLKEFSYRNKVSYIKRNINSVYFFDTTEFLRYFPSSYRWALIAGDVDYVAEIPAITKSRAILPEDEEHNNVLLNMDKVRHFTWIYDPYRWEQKQCRILFRGDARNKPRRLQFIDMWKDHPLCDVESTGAMALYDHLKSRYIMALEGNDVASNLKWVMSSNSIAIMPRPTCETWYMEARLKPDYHYIEIADDYHDLIDKITYYEEHPDEAKAIVQHAHKWIEQFKNKKIEKLISLMVLDKYFRITGQRQ